MSDQNGSIEQCLPPALEAQYVALLAFPNLYQGWEMDEWSWVATNKSTGEIVYISTSHGNPFVLSGEKARKETKDFLANYEEAIALAKLALDMLP